MLDDPHFGPFLRQIPPTPGEVHLNAGTLSPTPDPVMHAVDSLRRMQASTPSSFFFFETARRIKASRDALSRFLNARPQDIFLLPNVTTALNLVMQSIRLAPGDEILTTDHEYGAMRLLLEHVARRDGSIIRIVELARCQNDPGEVVEAFRRSISHRTRVMFFSHITSASALVLPADALCKLARQHNILSIVDGAHAPAHVHVELSAIDADAYGANCHKWMMAPAGCGFLYARPSLKPKLQPLILSWGNDDFARSPETDAHDALIDSDAPASCGPWDLSAGCTRLQYRLEYLGVYDRTPQMVLPETIQFLGQIGLDRLRDRAFALARFARSTLADIGWVCRNAPHPAMSGCMSIFALPDHVDPNTFAHRLWTEHRILCPVTRVGESHFLRVSTGWFNTIDDIRRLSGALRSFM